MPKITLRNTGLHEIWGRDYGIEEPCWGSSWQSCKKQEKCTKKRGMCKAVVLRTIKPIAFLTFSLPSRRRILRPLCEQGQIRKELDFSVQLFQSLPSITMLLRAIDLFSLYVLFSQYRSRANTLENCFFQISSYSPAYLRIIYEKTKGQVPLGPLLGKQNIQA